MRKLFWYALLFLSGSAYSHQSSAVYDLQKFLKLSQQCYLSAHATNDQQAFDTFKKINNFYIAHREDFKQLNTLDTASAEQLASECSQVLIRSVATSTKTIHDAHEATASLADAMTLFTRATPQLLTSRTTSALFGRITLLSLIELTTFLIEGAMQPETPSSSEQHKQMPALNERIKAVKDIPLFSGYFAKLMGLNIAKALSIGAVNEYTQKGISPYFHKLAETILPKLVAIVAAGILEYNKKNRLGATFWQRSALKVASPLVLGKAFVSKSHTLYKPLLLLSYIFPFFSGASGDMMLKNSDYSLNAWGNIFMDGAASAVIFSGIPAAVEKLLPKNDIRFNPSHRRKAIRNSVRAMFDKTFSLWNKEAFN